MADDNHDKWNRLPKLSFSKKAIARRMKKVEGATKKHAHKFIIKRWKNIRDVQSNIVMWVIAVGVLIGATGLQLFWFQNSYKTTDFGSKGTYAEAVLGPVDSLNPIFASTSAEQSISSLMFSRIFRYDTTGNLNYDLATALRVNDKKTVYTIDIRPDVKWHDSQKLTARDIVFTVDLIKNPNVRSNISGWKDVTAKVIDDDTVEFSMPTTYSAFEHALTFPIIPEHILGKVTPTNILENTFSQEPIGSGPYKLRFMQSIDTDSGRKVVYMARNENYYRGTSKLERFQLHVYKTNEAIIKALNSNEVNAAADLSLTDVNNIDSKRYRIVSKPIQSGVYAILNTKSQILKDLPIRRALQLSVNTKDVREKLSDKVLELDLPFVSGQLSGSVPKAQAYDKTAAEKILNDQGWVVGKDNVRYKDGQELKLSVVAIKNTEFERVLEKLAGSWRSIGVVVETKTIDPSDTAQNQVQGVLQSRNYDVLLYQLDIGADPDVYAYWHSSQATSQGLNFADYANVISDDALSSARTRVEPALRNAKYITFAKQWLADVPAIGLYQPTAQYVNSNSVKSFNQSNTFVTATDRYSDVLDWAVGKESVYKTP